MIASAAPLLRQLNEALPGFLVAMGLLVLAAVVGRFSLSSMRVRTSKVVAGVAVVAMIASGCAGGERSSATDRAAGREARGLAGRAESSTSPGTSGGTGLGGVEAGGRDRSGTSVGGLTRGQVNRAGARGGTIKIGFIGAANASSGAASLGATLPDQGDTKAQLRAVTKWINNHGGIADRKMQVIQHDFDLTSNDPTQATKLCHQFVDDDHVFAVIGGLGVDLPCFVQRRTLVIMASTTNPSQVVMKSYAPYVWLATAPDVSVAYTSEIDALAAQGWFARGVKIGFFVQNTPDMQAVYRNIVVPRIARLGYAVADKQDATNVQSFSDVGKYAADAQATILKWKAMGINRVVIMYPFGGALFIFAQQAEQAKFYPIYGVGTQDTPATNQSNVPASQFKGALGASSALGDVDDRRGGRFPSGPAEKQCLDVMAANGQKFRHRSNALVATALCDSFFLLWEGARGLTSNLSARTWASVTGNLGSRFQAASLPQGASELIPGRPEVSRYYRLLKYDGDCSCFAWTSRALHKDPM
jgi:ABC-type branched-subunit amino acid transport system substrate-binding protein